MRAQNFLRMQSLRMKSFFFSQITVQQFSSTDLISSSHAIERFVSALFSRDTRVRACTRRNEMKRFAWRSITDEQFVRQDLVAPSKAQTAKAKSPFDSVGNATNLTNYRIKRYDFRRRIYSECNPKI